MAKSMQTLVAVMALFGAAAAFGSSVETGPALKAEMLVPSSASPVASKIPTVLELRLAEAPSLRKLDEQEALIRNLQRIQNVA